MTTTATKSTTLRRDDTLKVIAIVTMLIDHIGHLLLPELIILRMIGRVSFPIFAYLIATGYHRTRDYKKYALRLTGFALISQLPYAYFTTSSTINFTAPNIFFTLLFGLLLLPLFHHEKFQIRLLAAPLALLADVLHLSYGFYGVMTIVMFSVFAYDKRFQAIGFILLNGLYLMNAPGSVQPLAFFALPIIWYTPQLGLKVPKYIGYGFYPIHLIVLKIISTLISN